MTTFVKFKNLDHEEMTTTAENWIRYDLFDAETPEGETFPVRKEDSIFINTFDL